MKNRPSKIHGEGHEWTARESWENAFSTNLWEINARAAGSSFTAEGTESRRKIAVPHSQGSAVGQRGGGDPFAAEKPKTGLHESWEKSPSSLPAPRTPPCFSEPAVQPGGCSKPDPASPSSAAPLPRSRSARSFTGTSRSGGDSTAGFFLSSLFPR